MKLEDVKQVKQTSNPEEANRLLKEGFILTRLFNCRTKSQEMESTMPMYVLANKDLAT